MTSEQNYNNSMNRNPNGIGGWIKGQSGNPGGRPKNEVSVLYWIKRYLEEDDPKEHKPRAQLIAEAMVNRAIAGDSRMMKEIVEIVDGKKPTPLIKESNHASLTEIANALQDIYRIEDAD